MRKNIRVTEPSAEMQMKIQMARHAISSQKMRMVKCPYCHHNSIAVFEDTRGHLETKCAKCGKVVLVDLVNTRKTRATITF